MGECTSEAGRVNYYLCLALSNTIYADTNLDIVLWLEWILRSTNELLHDIIIDAQMFYARMIKGCHFKNVKYHCQTSEISGKSSKKMLYSFFAVLKIFLSTIRADLIKSQSVPRITRNTTKIISILRYSMNDMSTDCGRSADDGPEIYWNCLLME